MDMLTQAAPALVGVSVVLVVVFCEIIKKIDKQERLKCTRPYQPALLAAVFAGLLAAADTLTVRELPFYWLLITGASMFFYDAILQKIKDYKRKKNETA